VVGGLVAFGLIGIFVGPVVLAVAHTLLSAWVDEEIGGGEPLGPPAP
jgi:predicted PurR-regulated permease PerM